MHPVYACEQVSDKHRPQVFYANPTEVYRDLLWDDVTIDEVEYTYCRYTPIVTEVRAHLGGSMHTLGTAACTHTYSSSLFRMHETLARMATTYGSISTASASNC